ncbi:MAG: hypothetical protein ACFFD2_03495 [Promethearchaeota archaeon]
MRTGELLLIAGASLHVFQEQREAHHDDPQLLGVSFSPWQITQ